MFCAVRSANFAMRFLSTHVFIRPILSPNQVFLTRLPPIYNANTLTHSLFSSIFLNLNLSFLHFYSAFHLCSYIISDYSFPPLLKVSLPSSSLLNAPLQSSPSPYQCFVLPERLSRFPSHSFLLSCSFLSLFPLSV